MIRPPGTCGLSEAALIRGLGPKAAGRVRRPIGFHRFPSTSAAVLARAMWWFPLMGVPQHGWFMMENHIKMDDVEVPPFQEPSMW